MIPKILVGWRHGSVSFDYVKKSLVKVHSVFFIILLKVSFSLKPLSDSTVYGLTKRTIPFLLILYIPVYYLLERVCIYGIFAS